MRRSDEGASLFGGRGGTGLALQIALRVGLVLALGASAALAQVTFYTDYAPYVRVSRDGSTVGGWDFGGQGFLIDPAGSVDLLGSGIRVRAFSADGSIVTWDDLGWRLFIDDGVTVDQVSPPAGYSNPLVTDVAPNGDILAGSMNYSSQPVTERHVFFYDRIAGVWDVVVPWWEAAPGVEIVLPFSTIEAMSSDGSTVVGGSAAGGLAFDAIRVSLTGEVTFLDVAFALEGASFAAATAVDGDANVIAGWADVDFLKRAWIAYDDVVSPLGFEGTPTAITANGYRVVGAACFIASCAIDPSWRQYEAFYWTPDTGLQRVAEVLENEHGFDLGGWALLSVEDISDDGLVMAGRAESAEGALGTWTARLPATIEVSLPEPSFGAALTIVSLVLAGARRRRLAR